MLDLTFLEKYLLIIHFIFKQKNWRPKAAFSEAELQHQTIIRTIFGTKIGPFLMFCKTFLKFLMGGGLEEGLPSPNNKEEK